MKVKVRSSVRTLRPKSDELSDMYDRLIRKWNLNINQQIKDYIKYGDLFAKVEEIRPKGEKIEGFSGVQRIPQLERKNDIEIYRDSSGQNKASSSDDPTSEN